MEQCGGSIWQHFKLLCFDQQVILATVSYCAPQIVHHIWQYHYGLQAHQLLMRKPTCLIIHQYGFLVSNYNYGVVWRFRHLEKCIMEMMSCFE